MKQLTEIFFAFCKVGALTFGGGYAMLPILQREVVEKKRWITEEEMIDYYAVGQCLPGVIAVNTATFVGQHVRGKAGGVAAALGVVFPALIIIMVVAAFIQNFIHLPLVQNAFYGIRIAVAALIVNAIVSLWKKSIKDATCLVLFAAAFLLSAAANVPAVYIIIAAVVLGMLIQRLRKKPEQKKDGGGEA